MRLFKGWFENLSAVFAAGSIAASLVYGGWTNYDRTKPLNDTGTFQDDGLPFNIVAPDEIVLQFPKYDASMRFLVEGVGKLKLVETKNPSNFPPFAAATYEDSTVQKNLYNEACEHAEKLTHMKLPPAKSKHFSDYKRAQNNAGEFWITACPDQDSTRHAKSDPIKLDPKGNYLNLEQAQPEL